MRRGDTDERIQVAARTGSVFVDESTFNATERAVELHREEPIDAKGKSSPVAVWEALRARARLALPLTWVFNVVGLLDLIHAFYQGLRHDVQLGAAYFIPTFVVPALVITHGMMFRMLVRHPR